MEAATAPASAPTPQPPEPPRLRAVGDPAPPARRKRKRGGQRAAGNRPTSAEIEIAVLEMLSTRSSEVLAHARRFASNPEDAEDAFQRGLEILLTKAPSTDENDLVPFLKTCIKHEAFALAASRRRSGMPLDAVIAASPTAAPGPDEQVERIERLRVGAEAMALLKPQEIRALLLRAEGHSYTSIAAETGWTYTKVNRALTEGRRAFLARVQGIESGEECRELEPLLSALADGEADAAAMVRLRPHLRGCPGCRATVHRYRAAPRELAAVAPPVALLGSSEHATGLAQRLYESATIWIGERATLVGAKVQGVAEATGAGKVAAIAASSAAIASGGVAAIESGKGGERDGRSGSAAQTVRSESRQPAAVVVPSAPVESAATAPSPPAQRAEVDGQNGRSGDGSNERAADRRGSGEQPVADALPPATPADEFLPGPAEERPASSPPGGGGAGSGGSAKADSRPSGGGGTAGGEFGP